MLEKLSKLDEFPENLQCSNINGDMHKLLAGECLDGSEKCPLKNALVFIY